MRKKNYVGIRVVSHGTVYQRFLSAETPTKESHGDLFGAVIGPFRTKGGALWCVHAGRHNPHTGTAAACDRLAKENPDEIRGLADWKLH